MESQIENAIDVALNSSHDSSYKAQAFDYLNQLRSDPNAWQACIALFTRSPEPSNVVRLVSLEIVNHAVSMGLLGHQDLLAMRDALLAYVRIKYAADSPGTDEAALQNKLTQTLTFLFTVLYRQGWESFFDDFLSLTAAAPGSGLRDNPNGVVLYLRILGSIHDEIADVLMARNDPQTAAHTALKDQMRVEDVPKVALSWQDILTQYRYQHDAIVEMTLKVIGKWASWIDISLLVSQGMLNNLLPFIGRASPSGGEDTVRDAAIDALTEIAGKKMRPVEKTQMIDFLDLRSIIQQLIDSPPLKDLQNTPSYDTDLGEAVAKLVNTVMTDLVKVLETKAIDDNTKARAHQLLLDFVPLLLRFFRDEFDEICSTVIPCLTDILTFLRKLPEVPTAFSEMLLPILRAIVMKMRYDETATWGSEDDQTDEAEFQELRKKLQNLQKSVAAVDQGLYMQVLSEIVGNTFQTLDQQGSQMDWRDLDLALHEMYLLGELALPNQGLGTKSSPNTAASERLMVMMTKMVESGIASFPHPAILLQYMEICVRYCVFFETNTQYIGQVLENFVRLVHHDHVRVKSRSWYLFHRFVKHLRAQVGNVAETVIQSIGDLLPIKAEVPGDDADDDMSSDETDNSADAIFTSQLFLYEAIGCISSTSSTPVEKQALYARSVMDPLFSDLQNHLEKAKGGDAQATLQIHHIVMALGTLAHGFSDWSPGATSQNQRPPPEKALSDEFARAAEAILIALRELNSSGEIRTACRSAFSRLLGVLGSAVLPQLPQWIEGLLSQSSSKDEMAMFLRLLDQVVYGFKSEIYDVLNLLLTPLLQRVFGGLEEPINGTDDEIQLAELRREYLSFIGIILNNDLGGVLVSETNQGFFDPLIRSIIGLAREIDPASGNLPASRLAFAQLSRMATVWGGPDIGNISSNPTAPTESPSPAFPGFEQFLIERFHSIAWEVLQDPRFKPATDAQTRQVLNEIAGLEQSIYLKTGQTFIYHLQSTLPTLGVDADGFLRAMTTSTDRKVFAKYILDALKGGQQQ